MTRFNIKLDHAGIAEILKSAEMRSAIHDAAETIAAHCRSAGVMVEGVPGKIPIPVEVKDQITDRARSSVTLAHPSGLAVQAKDGLLTRGAAAAGLEVSGGGSSLLQYTTKSGKTRTATAAQVANWTRGRG